jgi:hypothetical protein
MLKDTMVERLRDLENPLPKTAPLRGSLHLEWKRCSRTICRCASGRLHGPYFFRHWREDGRQRKAYVPAAKLATTLLSIEAHRAASPTALSILTSIRSARGSLT